VVLLLDATAAVAVAVAVAALLCCAGCRCTTLLCTALAPGRPAPLWCVRSRTRASLRSFFLSFFSLFLSVSSVN
jgi:hypothetical protein